MVRHKAEPQATVRGGGALSARWCFNSDFGELWLIEMFLLRLVKREQTWKVPRWQPWRDPRVTSK
jgi:hypothetical protein